MISFSGRQKHIGSYFDEGEAAHAYDAFIITAGLGKPRNFPDENEDDVVAEAARVLARVRAFPKSRPVSASGSAPSTTARDAAAEKAEKGVPVSGTKKRARSRKRAAPTELKGVEKVRSFVSRERGDVELWILYFRFRTNMSRFYTDFNHKYVLPLAEKAAQ